MRMTRVKVQGEVAVYHCITRIVGGAMLLDKKAKEVLRRQMKYVAEFCGVELLTYCIMTNHFHVLVRVPERVSMNDEELLKRFENLYSKDVEKVKRFEGILKKGGVVAEEERAKLLARMGDVSQFLKELKQRFSIWYNKSHGRYGTLWAERFKSVLVQDSPTVLRSVAAYIDLNPVRAGIVEDPKEYRWCGYAEAVSGNAGFRKSLCSIIIEKNTLRTVLAEYRQLLFLSGSVANQERKKAIRQELVEQVLKDEGELSQAQVLRLKVRYFSDGLVIGSAEFVEAFFNKHRDQFGEKRKTGARAMKGFGNAGLAVVRDLRKQVFT